MAHPKGVSGNPSGKIKLPDDLNKELRMSSAEFKRILNKNFYRNMKELQEILKDPATIGLELAVVTILVNSIKDGDQKRLEMLLSRSIGNVSQDVTFGGQLDVRSNNVSVVVTIPSNGFDLIGGARDVTNVNAKDGNS